jgi:DNA helicase-2/ATP-dependent DNA helicase PcrA
MPDGFPHLEESVNDRAELLEDLNPAQKDAVTHPGGPLLIVAGAGSGKTRVLARRAAWLIAGGLPGPALLAITFTNKAAQVLRSRLAALPGAAGVWAGTFHALGAWILRRHGEKVGVPPHFTIADRDDQERLIKAVLDEHDAARLKPKAGQIASWISRAKNGERRLAREIAHEAPVLEAVATAYAARLKAAGLLDFDDLLGESLRALKESPETAAHLRARFAHVLVDEYQDTNRVQRELVLALLGPAKNLTVVGDPDQSIYRWRGAVVANILEFGRDLPGARTVLLERNYRSGARILRAAEAVIAKNRQRVDKRLVAHREDGEKVRVVRAADPHDEADVVAQEVERWRRRGGRLSGVAVVYRVNALSRTIEAALRLRGIPYRVVAGQEFFQRQEVKDVLAYARLVENPRDEAAFARVANVPRRGVGDTSLARVRALARAEGAGWEQVVRGEAAGVPKKARAALLALADLLDQLRALPRAPVGGLLGAVVERTGYLTWLGEGGDDAEGQRSGNVHELLAAAREYDESVPEGALGGFLETTGLVSDQDALEPEAEQVSLLSAHAAKGLEFPLVIVVGAEHGLFPHMRSLSEDAALEEERRLFYVAMTRAMDRLVLTHAAWRSGPMGFEPRLPSPFLRDIPAAVVEGDDRVGRADRVHEHGAEPAEDPAEEPVFVREERGFEPGDRVRHAVFGAGRLFAVDGTGGTTRLTIDFDQGGRRQIALGFARLERLP